VAGAVSGEAPEDIGDHHDYGQTRKEAQESPGPAPMSDDVNLPAEEPDEQGHPKQ